MQVGDLVKTKGDPYASLATMGIILELGFHYILVRWNCGIVQQVHDGYRSLEVVSEGG
jgi:hypothetical protein